MYDEYESCDLCAGDGSCPSCLGTGFDEDEGTCFECDGTGECPECDGLGEQ